MPNLKHTELEIKLDASGVDTLSFLQWCIGLGPTKYEHAIGPDVYYKQGSNTIRHRWFAGPAGELTVKLRKSNAHTTDRVEIDLQFDGNVSQDDVTAFLVATGWQKLFTLQKDCHIFWLEMNDVPVSVVLYDVWEIPETKPKRKRFLEVEIDKGFQINQEKALQTLEWWRRRLADTFQVTKPMNLSLYEIYSGKKYKTVKGK